jgi:hypothetical protein
VDTGTKTARLIIGIAAEEWNRRHAAVRKKLEPPEKLTDDEYCAVAAEHRELRKLGPIFVREADTRYTIASAFTAGAELVIADATTTKEADQLTSKYEKKITQGMKKRGIALPKKLTDHEEKVLDVIRENPGHNTMKYCKALHAAKVYPPKEWTKRGCPRTYPEACAFPRWRRKIIREKSSLTHLG